MGVAYNKLRLEMAAKQIIFNTIKAAQEREEQEQERVSTAIMSSIIALDLESSRGTVGLAIIYCTWRFK